VGDAGHVLVAVSGGADSVALLHLLRFHTPVRLTAAHFDHRMRGDSGADAAWVRGLCRAWDVPLIEARAEAPIRSEGDARAARYAFLRRAQDQCGAAFLATAHHADDQAETVIFRIMRGTGLTGLAGIPERGPRGLIRPLLPVRRDELRDYARRSLLRWREDPTNRELGPMRNRIRHGLLPRLPEEARQALIRLASLAAEAQRAVESRVERALAELAVEENGAVLLERGALDAYDSPIAAGVLRRVLRRFGTVLDRPGTRTALQFIRTAPSGRTLTLAGGRVRIATEFGRARVEPVPDAPPADVTVEVRDAEGERPASIGGKAFLVQWSTSPPPERGQAVTLDPAGGPFTVRPWLPGDRIRMPGGTRTLKKLFNEARVPRSRRARIPVVADATGRVVWVVGLAHAADPAPPRGPVLFLTITDA
jgi:tRNA(Ile)-lysidine synthase